MQIIDIFDNGHKTRGVYLVKCQMASGTFKNTKGTTHGTQSWCFSSGQQHSTWSASVASSSQGLHTSIILGYDYKPNPPHRCF